MPATRGLLVGTAAAVLALGAAACSPGTPATAPSTSTTVAGQVTVAPPPTSTTTTTSTAITTSATTTTTTADAPIPGARTVVVQQHPGWGLDRISQHKLPLDGTFRAGATGLGVTVYTVDTGLQAKNPAFGGRASLQTGFTPKQAPGGTGEEDGSGVEHGTFVAGIVAGDRTGVARKARVVVAQAFCCGPTEFVPQDQQVAFVVRALDWIGAHAKRPAVVNISAGYDHREPAVDDAVRRLLARDIPVVASAGNESGDTCGRSPATVLGVIVVAASTVQDRPDPVSNLGHCVNLFAPGHDITSLRGSDPAPYRYADVGATSWATPYVTGAVALYLSVHPRATVADVRAWVLSRSTKGALKGVPDGTPNRLLYIGDL